MIKCKNGHFYDDKKYASCPYCKKRDSYLNDGELTISLKDLMLDDDKTIPAHGINNGNKYITGWLVCWEGLAKGRDYKIYDGYTRIGRGYHMDISIPEDISITRDNHCSIAYDERNNLFYLVPAGGNLVYLNGEMLTGPTLMKKQDKIQLGGSQFIFIPFCEGELKW